MVGGSQQLFDKSLPVLEMMGKKENIFFCGGPGAGLATKQLNNYLGYIGYMGLCEGTYTMFDSACICPEPRTVYA